MKIIKSKSGAKIQVDDDDFEWLSKIKWHVLRRGKGYATWNKSVGYKKYKTFYMHRMIMKTPNLLEVDHIDGNVLNNQKSNLRNCTTFENRCNHRIGKRNRSGFKGVSWSKKSKKWECRITCKRVRSNPKFFNSPILAARAYDKMAKNLHGRFARTNKMMGLL